MRTAFPPGFFLGALTATGATHSEDNTKHASSGPAAQGACVEVLARVLAVWRQGPWD